MKMHVCDVDDPRHVVVLRHLSLDARDEDDVLVVDCHDAPHAHALLRAQSRRAGLLTLCVWGNVPTIDAGFVFVRKGTVLRPIASFVRDQMDVAYAYATPYVHPWSPQRVSKAGCDEVMLMRWLHASGIDWTDRTSTRTTLLPRTLASPRSRAVGRASTRWASSWKRARPCAPCCSPIDSRARCPTRSRRRRRSTREGSASFAPSAKRFFFSWESAMSSERLPDPYGCDGVLRMYLGEHAWSPTSVGAADAVSIDDNVLVVATPDLELRIPIPARVDVRAVLRWKGRLPATSLTCHAMVDLDHRRVRIDSFDDPTVWVEVELASAAGRLEFTA